MRRMVAVQREMQGGETSQSDWSEEEEEEEERGETDDGGLDQLSMAANGGLTDAEGAMSGEEILFCSNKNIFHLPSRRQLNLRLWRLRRRGRHGRHQPLVKSQLQNIRFRSNIFSRVNARNVRDSQ